MASRNAREGIYAGHHDGHHVRHPKPPDTVWEGDEVLFKVPTPSGSTAWAVQFMRHLLQRDDCYCGGWDDATGSYHQQGCPEAERDQS